MQKNSEDKIYPASLTKMMTAIVAIESLPDLNEKIKLTSSTFRGLYEADASMAGFQPGEEVRAIDLLYGVLLPSGAECCVALADQIAGSEEDFVRLMNQKAADLGMVNTHFENATGLHNDNHYTTVKDLAVLLSYALKNDTFREIFTSSRHSTQPTNLHPYGITLNSILFEELNDQNMTGREILGGKTGYTGEAGLCLASLARVDEQEYILVSAGAKGDHHSEQYNITDALAVYDSIGEQ
jgi:D-alanyl-D-alanine carboxypeptidase (penicillin-binding protein 5/6)